MYILVLALVLLCVDGHRGEEKCFFLLFFFCFKNEIPLVFSDFRKVEKKKILNNTGRIFLKVKWKSQRASQTIPSYAVPPRVPHDTAVSLGLHASLWPYTGAFWTWSQSRIPHPTQPVPAESTQPQVRLGSVFADYVLSNSSFLLPTNQNKPQHKFKGKENEIYYILEKKEFQKGKKRRKHWKPYLSDKYKLKSK